MLSTYLGIESKSKCVIVVQKSRFLVFAYPIFSKKDIITNLKKIKEQYDDATHICYAYVLNDGESVQEKYSDDGEPSGTAGRPIIEVIKKRNLTNVLVVVVRYFGKIKLGAGGLTRTYSACASQVLDLTRTYQYDLAMSFKIEIESNDYFKFFKILNSPLVLRKNETFDDYGCHIILVVSLNNLEKVKKHLKSIQENLLIEQECYVYV